MHTEKEKLSRLSIPWGDMLDSYNETATRKFPTVKQWLTHLYGENRKRCWPLANELNISVTALRNVLNVLQITTKRIPFKTKFYGIPEKEMEAMPFLKLFQTMGCSESKLFALLQESGRTYKKKRPSPKNKK
jgi:hypothetical protein